MSKENVAATENTDMVAVENQNVFPQEYDNGGNQINMEQGFYGLNQQMFTTIQADTPEGKLKLLGVMGDPELRLKEEVNKEIVIEDIYCEVVQLPNDKKGGRLEDCPRCIILDKDGHTHGCTSFGVYNMLRRIYFVMEGKINGVKVLVKQVSGKNENTILTLKVIG